MIYYPSSMFDWNSESKVLSTEASMLRQFDDKINITSTHNGHTATFELFRTQLDAECDVMFWEYRPTGDTMHLVRPGTSLIIYND